MERVTLKELLEAREARAAHQWELMNRYPQYSLISMTLNIPGPIKDSSKYRDALVFGVSELKKHLEEVVFEEIRWLKTGSEAFLVVNEQAFDVKKKAVMVEEESPVGRLLDIDVIGKEGPVSRTEVGGEPRKCLLCDDDAKVCARSQKHSLEELLIKIDEIIRG
ncbi:MAG: citrate lyase holo-[Firmicutes bacterium]|nr:citrate lyase holo-[acyl-carrier protein] synthase [Bacillota bacterium]